LVTSGRVMARMAVRLSVEATVKIRITDQRVYPLLNVPTTRTIQLQNGV